MMAATLAASRTGIMDEYRERLFQEQLSGIPLSAWQKFLSAFSEDKTEVQINRAVDQAIAEAARVRKPVTEGVEAAKDLMTRVLVLLG